VTPGIDYPALLRRATLRLVHDVLEQVAREGLPGEHHLFITFRTAAPGAQVPVTLVREYPETMTVVLQHQYWDLIVGDEEFEVTLRFGGSYERLRVPYDAVTTFVDPSVPFGLDFTQFEVAGAADAGAPGPRPVETPLEEAGSARPEDEPSGDEPPPPEPPRPGDVLPFRRKDP
jgi:hypothetical protein